MLHEVLLALSGHPTPLWDDDAREPAAPLAALLSPAEAAQLKSLGELATRHRQLRRRLRQIAAQHASVICRAVATAIQQTHLARFQQAILDVEARILTRDARLVGAYDIVPLASVVGAFDGWHRLMAWLGDLAYFVQPPPADTSTSSADADADSGPVPPHKHTSGAMLINELRAQAHTGFPDIHEAAVGLSQVAEAAWLRQLSGWLLYGQLPVQGASDFFIKAAAAAPDERVTYTKDKALLPSFVSPAAAKSIMFIGTSRDQVRRLAPRHTDAAGRGVGSRAQRAEEMQRLAAAHLARLSALSLPIQPPQLSRAVAAVKLSLSQHVLQHVLPLRDTLRLLACFRQFFLLGRGEFAVALIAEAERRLHARQQSMGRLLQEPDPGRMLRGLAIRDTELNEALNQTWRALARADDDVEDDVLEYATQHITLAAPARPPATRPASADSVDDAVPPISPVAFNDVLFPSPSSLHMHMGPPLDLFFSARETESYSAINAYLLAIRRAQVRLAELWRRTAARRDHPSPSSGGRVGSAPSPESRRRARRRIQEARKVWATCSAAHFLISETAAYFEGEIIHESCDHFVAWVQGPPAPDPLEEDATAASGPGVDASAGEHGRRDSDGEHSPRDPDTGTVSEHGQRDPETLAAGHRSFLASLTYALLLTDVPYTRALRSLLGNLDVLIAFFTRLLDVQHKLDWERDAVDGTAAGTATHTEDDEQRTALELDRARKKVDSDLKSVVHRLRLLDGERIGSARYYDVGAADAGGFEPWKGGGVDRLLMKLEFGRMAEEAFELDLV